MCVPPPLGRCLLTLPVRRRQEFADKEQLIRHVASHGTAPADRRPFGCDTCGRRFRHEEWLKASRARRREGGSRNDGM